MADFGSLAKKMRKASVAVSRNADKLVVQVAETVLTNVVSDTPVDKGDARSNWQVNLNSPSTGTRDAYVPGKKGSTALDNIIASVEMGSQKLEAYQPGQTVHITNNLDYIGDLNNGASKQAPPGFVQEAVLESIAKIQKAGFTILNNIGE